MKVLVVHLLRLGDIIAATPVLRGLIDKYPDGQLHLLVNKECRSIEPLLPSQIKIIYFDRVAVQEGLGNPNFPTSFSVNKINSLIQQVNKESYDLIVNLTQNRFSAKLLALFDAKKKLGLEIESSGKARFHSKWFEYLNSPHSLGEKRIHYTDVFRRALRVHTKFPSTCLRTTPQGEYEAESILSNKKGTICLQLTSSEEKKCWSEDQFAKFVERVTSLSSEYNLVALCAPNEQYQIEAWKEKYDLDVTVFPCSLSAAFSLLKRANLLVTPDTSIKHLAAMADTPTIELSLGSSDFKVLGSYRSDSLILQSKTYCAPCPHHVACHRKNHVCSFDLDPEWVSLLVRPFIEKDFESIRLLMKTQEKRADVYITEIDGSGAWNVRPLRRNGAQEAEEYFEKLAWRVHLDFEEKQIAEVGTESISFSDFVQRQSITKSDVQRLKSIRFRLSGLVNNWMEKSDELLSSDVDGARVAKFNSNIISEIANLDFGVDFYRTELSREIKTKTPFLLLKQTRSRLRSLQERIDIENRILDMTLNRLEEKYER